MTACAPDELVEATNPTPQPNVTPKPNYRLKKVVYSFVNRYFFYENGRLSGERWIGTDGMETNLVTLLYDSQNRLTTYTTQSTRPSSPWEIGSRVAYLYNADGQIAVKQTYTLQQGGSPDAPVTRLASVDSLSYNSAGQVSLSLLYSYKQQTGNYSAQPVQLSRTTYQYDAIGNLTEEITLSTPLVNWGSSTTARKRVFEYDTKENPYHLIASPVFGQEGWSKNNVLKTTTYQVYLYTKGEQPDFTRSTPTVTDFTYEYKDALPAQKAGAATEGYEYETY